MSDIVLIFKTERRIQARISSQCNTGQAMERQWEELIGLNEIGLINEPQSFEHTGCEVAKVSSISRRW